MDIFEQKKPLGRPTLKSEIMEKHTITCTRSEWNAMRFIGQGNASLAIRQMIEKESQKDNGNPQR